MLNYFFVPGSKINKIPTIKEYKIDEIIIDLEDAIKESEIESYVELLIERKYFEHYVRIPLYSSNQKIDTSILKKLIQSGYTKFIFPKIENGDDFETIISSVGEKNIQIILLIETSEFLLDCKPVIKKYKKYISGLALGSHDFMAEIGGVHNLKNLEIPRQYILYLARTIGAIAIDIASMELKSDTLLSTEIIDGFEKGYDAKFFIHPWQIEIANRLDLYKTEEIEWAKKVISELDKVGSKKEFNPVVIDGQIIERPHLVKAQKIIKYHESK